MLYHNGNAGHGFWSFGPARSVLGTVIFVSKFTDIFVSSVLGTDIDTESPVLSGFRRFPSVSTVSQSGHRSPDASLTEMEEFRHLFDYMVDFEVRESPGGVQAMESRIDNFVSHRNALVECYGRG